MVNLRWSPFLCKGSQWKERYLCQHGGIADDADCLDETSLSLSLGDKVCQQEQVPKVCRGVSLDPQPKQQSRGCQTMDQLQTSLYYGVLEMHCQDIQQL